MPSATSETSVKDLHICILGSGMGGLACALALAHQGFTHIEIYEMASNLGFVGAGIQLAPNMARILDRLGCWEKIQSEAVDIRETSIRQNSTDEQLAHVDLNYIRKAYGYPHMVGHRASLAGSLEAGCKAYPSAIKFIMSTSAEEVTFGSKPSFKAVPRNGEPYIVDCDIILAADGVKSKARVEMLKALDVDAQVKDTNQAAYRIMLTREQMAEDEELLALLDSEMVTRWIGEKRHIIAYPVSNNTIYNLSTVQPDTNFAAAPSTTYTTKGSKTSMLDIFSDFCPKVQRMLQLVPDGEVCEWKLRVHQPLPTWVHGSVALVGDACHPTLPHLAQGAAQAIEDAAVLGVVLSRLPPHPNPTAIHKALKVYETLRKSRAETLVELAAQSGRTLHLGDGAAKEERDRQFKALQAGDGSKAAVPDKWADADVQRLIYGHDCWRVAEERFEEVYAGL